MSSAPAQSGVRISANELFKAQYNKYLRWSALIAVILVITGAMLSPNYVPNPYKLRQEEFEVVDIEEQEVIELPPPPKDAPPPPKVIEAAPDDEVTEEVEIADTLMDLDSAITSSMGDFSMGDDEGFVASSENPRIKYWQKPQYPEIARRSQLEGTVLVKVLVGPDGSVLQAQVVRPVHQLLDREAIAAAYKCTFFPGKQRNIPVKAWMALPFNFRLH
ncbi:MAG: energy transducer TonB [bacterium]|nr:energy transducer TonB [bacterium]